MMLSRYAKKYSKFIVGQLLFATIWVLSQLAIPRLMVDIIDRGIMVNDMSEIVNRGLLMLLATVVNIISLLISLYFLTRVTAGIARDLRGDLFEKIIDWSKETRGSFSNSTLVTRTVNDVKQVSILIDLFLRKIFTLTITVIGAVIIAFSIDVKMASIILVIIPIIFILALRLTTKALPKYSRIRKAIDRMNQRFRENITGIRVVKAFNKSEYETKMFREATEEACQSNVQAESTMMLLSPLVLFFTNILILILLYAGGVRSVVGTVTMGVLIGLIEYAIMALNNIQQFAAIITIFPRSKVSIDRIQEILSKEEVLRIEEKTPDLEENLLRFENVDFYYPNSTAAVLHDIHFDLQKGKTKAVIGSTGSGKSTLVRLLMRDYDAYRGQITYNGQDIKSLSNAEINQTVTHIPQTTFLFSGTIRENLQTGLTSSLTAVVILIGVVIMMFSIHVTLALLAIIVIPISYFLVKYLVKKAKPIFQRNANYVGHFNGQVEEVYNGEDIVKHYNLGEELKEEIADLNEKLYESEWKSSLVSFLTRPAGDLILNANYVLIAILGGKYVISGTLSLGSFQAFIQYTQMLRNPFNQVLGILNTIMSALASAERIFSFLDAEEIVQAGTEQIDISKTRGEIEFNQVDFGYTDQLLFNKVNLKINPGEQLAIVGTTGAGKTTLVNLLMRFYEINDGKIILDGHDSKQYHTDELRKAYAMVLQETWLFSGTIRENIAYGADISDEQDLSEVPLEDVKAAAQLSKWEHIQNCWQKEDDTQRCTQQENCRINSIFFNF